MPTEDRNYHIDRARAELDYGYRTDNFAAARAHLELAALHMKHLRDADDRPADGNPGTLAEALGAAMG
ncbi:MAG TPA: hypothetical protein VFW19_05875 [Allosphingosinicella sp.]|nr:hypothetical protein [Allosphingosinicella sp.]